MREIRPSPLRNRLHRVMMPTSTVRPSTQRRIHLCIATQKPASVQVGMDASSRFSAAESPTFSNTIYENAYHRMVPACDITVHCDDECVYRNSINVWQFIYKETLIEPSENFTIMTGFFRSRGNMFHLKIDFVLQGLATTFVYQSAVHSACRRASWPSAQKQARTGGAGANMFKCTLQAQVLSPFKRAGICAGSPRLAARPSTPAGARRCESYERTSNNYDTL